MEGEVEVRYGELPPSVNRLYTVRNGRKILSGEAKRYKNKIKIDLLSQLIGYKHLGHNTPLSFTYDFYFSDMYNKGFPKSAKTLFKKKDVSNKIKLIEDAVCEVLDVDDSQVVHMEVNKWLGNDLVIVKVKPAKGHTAPQS